MNYRTFHEASLFMLGVMLIAMAQSNGYDWWSSVLIAAGLVCVVRLFIVPIRR